MASDSLVLLEICWSIYMLPTTDKIVQFMIKRVFKLSAYLYQQQMVYNSVVGHNNRAQADSIFHVACLKHLLGL